MIVCLSSHSGLKLETPLQQQALSCTSQAKMECGIALNQAVRFRLMVLRRLVFQGSNTPVAAS